MDVRGGVCVKETVCVEIENIGDDEKIGLSKVESTVCSCGSFTDGGSTDGDLVEGDEGIVRVDE